MDKDRSEKNKEMQKLLSKETTFNQGIDVLLSLRADVFGEITHIVNTYPKEAFWLMPYKNADGYHSKSLAYSIWHIFRIEDIVAHELVASDTQVLFTDDRLQRIASPIITTGNELAGDEIAAFSKRLDVSQLYEYAKEVKQSTDQILRELKYTDLKRRFDDSYKAKLKGTKCVAADEAWLIDYWCDKDLKGLIQMPFSRHWIMHVEAMSRIKNKLCANAKKGVDPIAYCGFSCRHCFLAKWCGSCRTEYNTCSFATCSPDGICPNTACCREKCYDGCYDCPDIMSCEKGFYVAGNDGANAAKAQALFIHKYGKKNFLVVQDRLHEKYVFSKTQEILGQDILKGLGILEELLG